MIYKFLPLFIKYQTFSVVQASIIWSVMKGNYYMTNHFTNKFLRAQKWNPNFRQIPDHAPTATLSPLPNAHNTVS